MLVGVGDGTTGGYGEVDQSAGTVTVSGLLVLGSNSDGNGTYNLTGGTLNDDLIVGDLGTGTFNNTGATNNVTGNLVLGNQSSGNGTYNLTAGGATSVSLSTVVGNQGTGSFLNDASTLTTGNLILAAGDGSSGVFTLQNGGSVNVGSQTNSQFFMDVAEHGTATYTQTSGTTTIVGALDIGRCGASPSGTCNDGDVGNPGTGTFNLSGGGVSVQYDTVSNYGGFVVVGDAGSGTVNQSGSATLSAGEIDIGRDVQGSGTYNLSDTASITLTTANGQSGTLYVAVDGQGNFKQSDSSMVSAQSVSVGNNTGGVGEYDLSDSAQLTLTGGLYVGSSGQGTFNQTGGTVTAGLLSIGNNSGGVGTYNLSGVSSNLQINGNAYVGADGSGTYSQTGGTANVTGDLVINNTGTPNGSSLSISGNGALTASTVTNNDLLSISGSGELTASTVTNNDQFNFQGGTVTADVTNNGGMETNSGLTAALNGNLSNSSTGTVDIGSGSTVNVSNNVQNDGGSVTVEAGSKLSANVYNQSSGTTKIDGTLKAPSINNNGGLLEGTGSLIGDLFNAGTLKPGDLPGTITLTGDYMQSSTGTFQVDLGGTSLADYGRLLVGGSASLNGALDLELVNGFSVANGDVFNIMDFSGVSGDFTSFLFDGSACTGVSSDFTCGGLGGGLYFSEQFVGNSALNILVLQQAITGAVPEPLTLSLFGAGLAGAVVMRRRKTK